MQATWDTLGGDGPSYLRLAQINFDHFGNDTVKAYNTGHYCAMKVAAEGDLETAYGMNKLGLTVKNKKGDEFTCWSDKQMFEEHNTKNKEMMRQSLQASVDEVYDAFATKMAKKPEAGYRAWEYAPNQVIASKTHSPLLTTYKSSFWNPFYWPVKVRQPFDDPWSKNYVEVGHSPALIDLYNKISSSEQWKKY